MKKITRELLRGLIRWDSIGIISLIVQDTVSASAKGVRSGVRKCPLVFGGVLRPPLSLLSSGGKCVICQTDMI